MANISIELAGAITLACSIIAIILSNLSHKRDSKKDAESEGRNNGMILTELGYIKSGIDDVKRKQEKTDENYVKIVSRLSTVEASVTAAHDRLDGLVPRRD